MERVYVREPSDTMLEKVILASHTHTNASRNSDLPSNVESVLEAAMHTYIRLECTRRECHPTQKILIWMLKDFLQHDRKNYKSWVNLHDRFMSSIADQLEVGNGNPQ